VKSIEAWRDPEAADHDGAMRYFSCLALALALAGCPSTSSPDAETPRRDTGSTADAPPFEFPDAWVDDAPASPADAFVSLDAPIAADAPIATDAPLAPTDAHLTPDAPMASLVPLCRFVGSRREGWYAPDGTLICTAPCGTATAICDLAGTRSEGWYASVGTAGCTGTRLIQFANCAP
jgi:hypothetical protein